MSVLLSASEIMRRSLVTLMPNDDVYASVARLLKDGISGSPVVDHQNNYLGVFSEKCSITALTEAVEAAREVGLHVVKVREFMTCELVTLSADTCVFEAIDHLLSRRISGAPVLDNDGRYAGVFSEKTAMRVLASALHDQLPGTNVGSYMNTDRNRIIDEEDMLLDVAHKFQQTPYRRLPVLHGNKLAGQVSRRDVLRAEYRLAMEVTSQGRTSQNPKVLAASQPKQIGDFMDTDALTAGPGADLLGIAQMFLNSPYRRLPIVENGKLIGQVSRRDLLGAAAKIMKPIKPRLRAETLYLSQVSSGTPPMLS
ncbi:CBS domain-containing protein [Rubripirellula reticaptiva]|uniref:Putative voltage-gated ClC-type chloride channel ClcB n=1 Tax=Rubripirellula reticaptiva TaxID=2528013 RepID=A0A5C6EN45_9BACT|nr:CBS domain-containing protein [Rubripirellula reticaptiva]TWU49784.1 putative voltage-gated ClC-type chloride channel ClcB [Rubripirellula reticaptiva]